jgi:parallel beta-helix repeat protein
MEGSANFWDDGYPSGGNYWSDYAGVDVNGDGIGDTPYDIDENNTDRYPLMYPWSPLPVHNINTGLGYATIQEAINANETLNGHTIFVEAGTYYENIVVNKSLLLIGQNKETTIIDGSGTGTVVEVFKGNSTITGVTIQNTRMGYYDSGIYVYNYSGNNIFEGNKILNCYQGIFLWKSSGNNIIKGNIIANNGFGIVTYETDSDVIIRNNVTSNGEGIWINEGTNISIIQNNIVYNHLHGIRIDTNNNIIYHNDIIDNEIQVGVSTLPAVSNVWDDGYPSGGNYWSDYVGVDVKNGPNQDLLGSDGIGDTPYTIDENNQDRYPLMRPWTLMPTVYTFSIVWGEETFIVSVESNSTVSSFYFSQPMKGIGFNVTGEAGTVGFCNVTIPKQLLYGEPWTLLIDGEPVSYTQTENATHSFLYFTYTHSTHEIRIIGTHVIEPPPSPPPPLRVSISPLSASILVGQSVTFTSTVTGGYTPYSYQWYLNGNPVSGATSDTWTFTPTTSGIYYVYLKVTDDTDNTTQSETARTTVTTVPVGGYSVPIQLPTTANPATIHIALLTILTAIFITIKRKTKRKH